MLMFTQCVSRAIRTCRIDVSLNILHAQDSIDGNFVFQDDDAVVVGAAVCERKERRKRRGRSGKKTWDARSERLLDSTFGG